MPLSMTPGSSIIASPELRCRHGLRRDLSSSALPILPAIRFTRGKYFGASRFTHLLRPAKLLAPLYGSDRHARPPGAFTSRLPTDRLPSPLLDMTTTATGLLCWRGSHPLEWQLASLHQTLFLHNGPVRGPGLSLFQRIMFIPLSWLVQYLVRFFVLVVPPIYLWSGVPPLYFTSTIDIINYQLPVLLVYFLLMLWITPSR